MTVKPISSLINHSFFYIIGCLLLSLAGYTEMTVLYLLLSLFATGVMVVLKESKIQKFFFVGGLAACIQWHPFLHFLPAAVSVLFIQKKTNVEIAAYSLLSAAVLFSSSIRGINAALLALLCGFAFYLSENYRKQQKLTDNYLKLKDNSWEQQRQLEDKNNELVVSQEASIELEVTQERNRIARDIHDNVGHLLSSALIQLGAVQTINQQDNLKKPLQQLHSTIDLGMNNIRSSVHNTFQDSLDFSQGLEILLKEFTFCPVVVDGDPGIIPKHLAQPLTMVFKEAFTNVMKHSNATEVRITISDLPAFYKCVIQDNGTLKKDQETKGIGLIGMQQRLKQFSGQIHVNAKPDRFTLNIILPKETEE